MSAFAIAEEILDDKGEVVDLRIIESNPAFAALVGVRQPQGATLVTLIQDIQSLWMANCQKVLRGDASAQFEAHLGSINQWFRISVSPLTEQPMRRLAIVFTDITKYKTVEHQAADTEQQLRLILESLNEYAIFSTDIERRITTWNKGAERLLGYQEAEILGQRADLIFTEEDRAAGACEDESRTAAKTGRSADERWHVKKDGTRFWGSGAMLAMRDSNADLLGFVKIFRDETKSREAKQALEKSRAEIAEALRETEKAREEAEFASQAKDQFLAVLSHELRSPLSPVLMSAMTLLRRKDLDPAIQRGLEVIRRNVETECKLIDDLLDITRISKGRIDIVREPMSLHQTLLRAAEIAKGDFEAKNQSLTVNLQSPRDEYVGDPLRLEQTVWNLLKNASKFTPPNGEIYLSTAFIGCDFRIQIADSGTGIPSERLEAIFESFTQADESIAKKFGGLGLGLAIAKAIVDAHGGRISAESAGPSRGSTFTIDLPFDGEPPLV